MSPIISPSESGGSQPVTLATKVLTDAQVKALAHPTPVQLVAAPGASFALVPIHATLRLTWIADYTNIDPGATLGIKIGPQDVWLAKLLESAFAVDTLLAGGEDASGVIPTTALATSGYFDGDIENKALFLAATNGAASDFTGGNAGNSLKVTILYYTLTF